MDHYFFDFVKRLVEKGGPEILEKVGKRIINSSQFRQYFKEFGDAMSPKTMQGFALQKPHGYAGDYEIIDKIYTETVSHDRALTKWDLYFHAQHAPRAV